MDFNVQVLDCSDRGNSQYGAVFSDQWPFVHLPHPKPITGTAKVIITTGEIVFTYFVASF